MTGKERAKYRAMANAIEPVFQIGKGGMSDALIKQTLDALEARELIKVKALLETIPETPRELADKLSDATGAQVIQVIGGCIVLYKENPELRAKEKEKEKRKKEAARKKRIEERSAKNAAAHPRTYTPAPQGRTGAQRRPVASKAARPTAQRSTTAKRGK